jgi:hypothetical protein
MDADLEAAATYLARFDPLAALRVVALRSEPLALALRGVAMAQLGDDAAAQKLLARAERAFARTDPTMHARILAARGEVALAARDLALAGRLLESAEAALARDRTNRLFVRLQRVRRLLLLGRLEEARALVAGDVRGAPPRLRALTELARADIAARRLRALEARAAIARARSAARAAAIPALTEEVERFAEALEAPVARIVRDGEPAPATLADVAALRRSDALVVDACRREIRQAAASVALAGRPVLFALVEALAASPDGASRAALGAAAFGARRVDDSLRVRLRVEIGRLRRALRALPGLDVEAITTGFALRAERPVVLVLPPAAGESSALLALLRGGEPWSTSALATALGLGQRAVQRALSELRDAGKVDCHGAGRSRRWVAPPAEGFATTLLLLTAPRRS